MRTINKGEEKQNNKFVLGVLLFGFGIGCLGFGVAAVDRFGYSLADVLMICPFLTGMWLLISYVMAEREQRSNAEGLLQIVQQKQEKFWSALRELENMIGYELDSNCEFGQYTIETLHNARERAPCSGFASSGADANRCRNQLDSR